MPRPEGIFTYDATLKRFRNAGGQLMPTQVVLPPAGPSANADDALELLHLGHVAGASGPEWLRQMMSAGLTVPCRTCGQPLGLGDVTMTSTHSRNWGA